MARREKRLRVHHVLCLPLFVGEGYSDSFSINMAKKKKWIWRHPREKLWVVCGPDMICGDCPNLVLEPAPFCKNGDNHAAVKDRELLEILGILENGLYSWMELLEAAASHMTEERFDASCGSCQWYEEGLCSYGKWQREVFLFKNGKSS